jgi:hypothetical protein
VSVQRTHGWRLMALILVFAATARSSAVADSASSIPSTSSSSAALAPTVEAADSASYGPLAENPPEGAPGASGVIARAPAAPFTSLPATAPPRTASAADSVNAPPPVTTTEIPPANLQQPPSIDNDPYSSSPPPVSARGVSQNNAADTAAANKAIQDYEDSQNLETPGNVPRLHTLNEFLSETSDTSPIGVELREDVCKLNSGAKAEGLAVLSVRKDSPAAKAGLQSAHNTTHQVLEGVSVVAALVFPPAIMATAIIDQTRVGESYDVIIGVDGKRVSNVIEFEDQVRDLKGGDIVYLTVVRRGSRLQIPVQVPPGTAWTY